MPQRASPNKATPWFEDNTLHIGHGDTEQTIVLGSSGWTAWLADATQFYVKNTQHGSFSCRKETRQRGGSYWSAYRRANGRTHRAYVGKDRDLTSMHLNNVAQQLNDKIYGEQGLAKRKKPLNLPHIQAVHTDGEKLWIYFTDGRVLGAPLAWFPRLVSATLEERQHWTITDAGTEVHWPDIDETVTVRGLMNLAS